MRINEEINWAGLRASQEKKDFYYLLGKEVTFKQDMINSLGKLLHQEGEKAIISDVEYQAVYWDAARNKHMPPQLLSLRINNSEEYVYMPGQFHELID